MIARHTLHSADIQPSIEPPARFGCRKQSLHTTQPQVRESVERNPADTYPVSICRHSFDVLVAPNTEQHHNNDCSSSSSTTTATRTTTTGSNIENEGLSPATTTRRLIGDQDRYVQVFTHIRTCIPQVEQMLPAVPVEERDNAAKATAPVTPPTNQRFGSTDLVYARSMDTV